MRTEIRDTVRETVFSTPLGDLREIARFDAASCSWHPAAFPVSDVEQVKVMTAFYRGLTIEPDREALEKARIRCEPDQQDAVTWTATGTSPLMHWVEWIAGVELTEIRLSRRHRVTEAF